MVTLGAAVGEIPDATDPARVDAAVQAAAAPVVRAAARRVAVVPAARVGRVARVAAHRADLPLVEDAVATVAIVAPRVAMFPRRVPAGWSRGRPLLSATAIGLVEAIAPVAPRHQPGVAPAHSGAGLAEGPVVRVVVPGADAVPVARAVVPVVGADLVALAGDAVPVARAADADPAALAGDAVPVGPLVVPHVSVGAVRLMLAEPVVASPRRILVGRGAPGAGVAVLMRPRALSVVRHRARVGPLAIAPLPAEVPVAVGPVLEDPVPEGS